MRWIWWLVFSFFTVCHIVVIISAQFHDKPLTNNPLDIFSEAIQLAEQIDDPQKRNITLQLIADRMAHAGLTDQSIKVVMKIQGERNQEYAWCIISETLADQDRVQQAVDIISKIKDESFLSQALGRAIWRRLKKNDLNGALEIAKSASTQANRSQAMSEIATWLLETGKLKESLELFEEEVKADPYLCYQFVWRLADKKQFSKALKIANDIKSLGYKISALTSISQSLVKVGRKAEAIPLIKRSLRLTKDIEDYFDREREIELVSTLVLAYGFNVEEIKQLAKNVGKENQSLILMFTAESLAELRKYGSAVQIAKLIDTPYERTDTFLNIAHIATKNGARAFAAKVLSLASEVVLKVKDKKIRAEQIQQLAEESARAGLFDNSIKFIQKIDDLKKRAYTLVEVFKIIKDGKVSSVKIHAMKKIANLLNSIDHKYHQADVYAAAAWTIVGELPKALKIAEQIRSSRERSNFLANVMLAVLTNYAIMKVPTTEHGTMEVPEPYLAEDHLNQALSVLNYITDEGVLDDVYTTLVEQAPLTPNQLKEFAEKVRNPELRYRAFIALASKLANHRMFQEALEAVKQILDEEKSISVLISIVIEMVKSGQTKQALKVLEQKGDRVYSGPSLLPLVHVLVEQKQFDLAVEIAQKMQIQPESKFDRFLMREGLLVMIASQMQKSGEESKAKQLLLSVAERVKHIQPSYNQIDLLTMIATLLSNPHALEECRH